MNKWQYPTVVIVGRTNVGKSTLFNHLSTQARSLVFDAPGVTRDFIKDVVSWQGHTFELIDTGGISFAKTSDAITKEVRAQAIACMEQAHLILFVVDGAIGLLPEDREIAKMLHKHGKRVALVVNKTDTKRSQEHIYEFSSLGFLAPIFISALHSRGLVDILEAIVKNLPEPVPLVTSERECKVVILGKPNVGKSSLLNLLVQKNRAIVSDVPGTTREPLKERVRFYHEDIVLTDTAGIRRKRSINEPLEHLMAKSTLKAVKDADVVILMVDAHQGILSDQELKLAFYAFVDKHKALIVVFNKQDLLATNEYAKITLASAMKEYDFLMKKVEQLRISCKTEENVGKLLPLVQKVWQRYEHRFDNEELTRMFKEALQKKPLYHNQELLIVYNAKQVKTAPITITLFVNDPTWFQEAQRAFLEHQLRQHANLKSVPIVFIPRHTKS